MAGGFCIGGIDTYAERVCRRRRDRGNEPMHAVRWLASPRQGKSSQREGNALFDDFWYFWSFKSTIKEKLFYVSIGSSGN